ncbi:LysM peptidoglycan-binding domain-containing protein [Abyssalbus ytuae]|uniref:LysM peptidoglycan-binding domain-containing protein n=1 Tax=Abyssalbus ytuae TaxID=2926907 RepID=A0A9E6ZP70_9FLAO|nr:LysM peptidoglycan-binding domain-containing protein [Abyssalbus ytuae]UOB17985.1 LysM peptidoglycan-binding domain-containing protein [Abyssalbus ytuae]
MKKLIVFFLTFFFCAITYAQQYKTHAVKEGETIESIAKKYKVTPYDIIKLNPEVKDGLKPNTILIISGGQSVPDTTEEEVPETPIEEQIREATSFSIHKVRSKETIYGIARMYGISEEDLKRYNKELYSRELKKGEKIQIPRFSTPVVTATNPDIQTVSPVSENKTNEVLPVDNMPVTGQSVIDTTKYEKSFVFDSFKTHKVRRKETLYSLAKKYNITEDEIKRYNKELYARPLKKGEKIQIPVFKEVLVKKEAEDPLKAIKSIHIVKPKETRWGIANSYGLTIFQLKQLNPEMGEIIKIGDTLIIPQKETIIQVPDSDNFVFYEVKPKETLYSLTRIFKISNDSLQKYNPALKDGLKAGMILKFPKREAEGLNVQNSLIVKKFSLMDSIKPMSTSTIAYFIPFRLEAIDFRSKKDIERNIEKSRNLNVALDFYTGVLIALDSVKKLGISVNTKIFDSEASEVIVSDLAMSNDLKKYDAIIGPFMPSAFNRLAEHVRRDSVPAFAPFSNNIVLKEHVFQTIPSDDVIRAKMIAFIKENVGDRQLIIISDKENEEVKLKLVSEFPGAKVLTPIENTFIRLDDINPLLSKEKENWVIVETNNIALLTNVSGVLNSSMVEDIKVTMLTTKRGSAYDSQNVSNFHLSNLNFHYPTVDRVSKKGEAFNKAYEKKYKKLPSRYATRGYDLTMDVALRLAYSKNLDHTARYIGETEYVENKFEYDKSYSGGHYNKGVYIVKYENLEIVEVENTNNKLVVENTGN